jgi:hypothetical protein
MSGAVPPLLQYAFMAWCSSKAQGQPLPMSEIPGTFTSDINISLV